MIAEDPVIDYAAWTPPQSPLTVVYSLPLFHEIDFVVNEGYRRIPHGGLEVGGLLFGRKQNNSVQIEAFRPIECEHSTGPSFVLSARDVERLQQQLRDAAHDPELQDLVPVGWFISHSRGDLILSDREVELFNQLFPRAHELTVLVKPVKFQPTRFAFLVRDAQSQLNRDGREQAIILPLPGKSSRATLETPAPSLPAPVEEIEVKEVPPAKPELPPEPPPAPELNKEAEHRKEPEPELEPEPKKESKPEPAPAPPPPPAVTRPPAPVNANAAMPHMPLTLPASRKTAKRRGISVLVSIFTLLLATALGFAVGYFAYSQLSFSAISMTIEDHPPVLFVSWPPSDSRDADSAFIRIDDGPPRPLTLEEKASGQAEVKMNGNSVKIEILLHNWLHESRGIIRYVRPSESSNTTSAPTTTEPASTLAP